MKKRISFYACIIAGVLLLSVVVVRFGNHAKQVEPTVEVDNNVLEYTEIAQELTVDNSPIKSEQFSDSSEALSVFVKAFNSKNLIQLSYIKGNSFATGEEDEYGSMYYITASKDVPTAAISTFSFYITSAGPNKTFDTTTLVLDNDDESKLLLKGEYIGIGSNSTDSDLPSTEENGDFGIGEIVANKLEEAEDTIPEEGTVPNKVVLTLNDFGGNGGSNSVKVKNGTHLKLYSFSVPTREHYEFKGYFSEGDCGGIQYIDENGIGLRYAAFDSDTTLFAGWKGNTVILTLENEGGHGTKTVSATYGSELARVSVPTKEGYIFEGYFEHEEGSGEQIYNAEGMPVVPNEFTQNTTLYAAWVADYFTVEHYVMNTDGLYPESPNSVQRVKNPQTETNVSSFADPDILIANGIVVEHAKLNGALTETVEITKDESVLTIYYKRCSYQVSLTANEGIASVEGMGTYLYGEKVVIKAKLTEGYKWDKWCDYSTGDIVSEQKDFSFIMGTSAVSFEAFTEAFEYSIKLDANGGSCDVSSVSVSYGDYYVSELPTASRKGYVFAGWAKSKGATEKDIVAETDIYKYTSNTTLYAVWTSGVYPIILDFQGGQGGTNYIEATYGSAMPKIQALPSREGYTFNGYYAQANGQGICYYDAKGTSKVNSDFTSVNTLYADWTALSKKINYYDEGGLAFSGTHEFGYPQEAQYGTTTALKSASKNGYVFAGWYSNSACTQKVKSVVAELYLDDEINLFARWTESIISITFDCQDADGISSTLKAGIVAVYGSYPSSISAKDLPQRAGYIFKGFYSEKNGAGVQYYDNTGNGIRKIDTGSNLTLYACWVAATAD